MIFHPSVIALYVASLLISFMICYSAYYALQILRKWDIHSGSELQLVLERRTYLIATILTYLFIFQLISLFLYVYTADHLHVLFVGAMCAAGTLYVNAFGYPTLILKIVNFLLAGVWLILNYVDNKAYDYPLIKRKYFLLLIMAPFLLAEAFLQTDYFLRLRPDVITSCCGTLFSTENTNITAELFKLPTIPNKIAFYLCIASTVVSGIYFYRKGKGGYVFSSLSIITFLVSIISVISFISLYFYELPTHHCPFCILQREYGYIGYPLYLTLFGSVVFGIGTGAVMPFRNVKSLSTILPSIQRRMTFWSVILLLTFSAVVTYQIVFSDFILEGY
jgi:hypothetical protein